MCLVNYFTRTGTPRWREAFNFTGHGSRTANHTLSRRTQICGVQYSISDRFLIDTPKRLEIDATRTKQSSQVISNRYKIEGSPEARSWDSLSAGSYFVRHSPRCGTKIDARLQCLCSHGAPSPFPFSLLPFPFCYILPPPRKTSDPAQKEH